MTKINVFEHAMRILATQDDIVTWGGDVHSTLRSGCLIEEDRFELEVDLIVASAQLDASARALDILERIDYQEVDLARSCF